jgi:hypothetical protein
VSASGGASSGGLLGRGGVELATDRGGELGQAAVALDAKPFWASGRPAAVHRRRGVHGVDLGRSAPRPDAVEPAESRARIAAARGGASSRLAAAALPTSSPLKVVMGGRINGDVERLPADTERRLEELERAGIDGFDRSLPARRVALALLGTARTSA